MLNTFFAREVRYVNKSLNAFFDLDECAELGQPCSFTLDDFSFRVAVPDRVPWIPQNLPQSQTEARRPAVYLQDYGLDTFALFQHVAWTLNSFGPRHLRNVDQPFHTGQHFYKCTEIRKSTD